MNYSIFFTEADGTEGEWVAGGLETAIDYAIEASSMYGRATIVDECLNTIATYEMGEEVETDESEY